MSQTYSRTKLIPAMILAIYVYGSIAALVGTILPQLGERFGLSADQLGLIGTLQALGLTIASVTVGPIVDNKGKKTALVGGLGLITLSLLALAHAASYATLLMAMFALGLGGGMLVTGANALISDVAEEKRSSALNFLNLFFGLGGLATPFLAANIPGLQSAYGLCMTLAVVTGITFLFHSVTKMPGPTGERSFRFSEAGELLGHPALYLLSSLLFLYVACEVGMWNWLVKLLLEQGLKENVAQNILSLGFALGILVGRVVVSRILLGVAEIKVTTVAAILMTITTYAVLHTQNVVMAGVTVFLAGLAMAPVFPTTLGMVGNVFKKATATAMGIVITSGWIGITVVNYTIGWIADQYKDDEHRIGIALLLLPAMSLLMILVNLALRPYVARKSEGTVG